MVGMDIFFGALLDKKPLQTIRLAAPATICLEHLTI
jgi:hypothetical protein